MHLYNLIRPNVSDNRLLSIIFCIRWQIFAFSVADRPHQNSSYFTEIFGVFLFCFGLNLNAIIFFINTFSRNRVMQAWILGSETLKWDNECLFATLIRSWEFVECCRNNRNSLIPLNPNGFSGNLINYSNSHTHFVFFLVTLHLPVGSQWLNSVCVCINHMKILLSISGQIKKKRKEIKIET